MFDCFDDFSAANVFVQGGIGDFFDKAARTLIVTKYCLGWILDPDQQVLKIMCAKPDNKPDFEFVILTGMSSLLVFYCYWATGIVAGMGFRCRSRVWVFFPQHDDTHGT